MKMIWLIVQGMLQVVAGYLVGFLGAMTISWGSGSELVVIPLGAALGVWLVGAGLGRLGRSGFEHGLARFAGALLGAGLGTLGLVVADFLDAALGFWPFLALPLLSLAGYHLLPKIWPGKSFGAS